MQFMIGLGAAPAAFGGRIGVSLAPNFRFGVSGLPQTGIERQKNFRWNGAERLGGRVAMQFSGTGEETVSIKGIMYPPRFGSVAMLEAMSAEAEFGVPRPLATSLGVYHGLWCIKSISDTQGPWWPNGAPRKLEFTIELTHYGSLV
jgi:hypothetical protein